MNQWECLAWIAVGIGSGWLANTTVQSRQGLIGDIIMGVLGALIGGVLFHQLSVPRTLGFNLWSIFVAFVWAVMMLGLLRTLTGDRVST